MSELSYLEKLLDGVEVEWSNLGNLCDIFTGGEAPQNHIKGDTPTSDYQYPIYGNGAEIYGYADSYRIGQDAVTISSIGANTGTIYFRKAFFTPIIRLKVVIPKHSWLLPRYLFHYLSSQTINSKSSSVPNMNASDVKKLSIPIPCPNNPEKSLAIQSEIVRILDTFTALTAELTAELTARKKQYNFYRDQLLSFKEGEVEWKTLGDVLQMRAGQHISASKIMPYSDDEYSYPCFGGNGVRGFVENKSHNGAHLLIGRQGALCGNVQRMKGQFYATEHAVVVTSNGEIDIDWAFHMLTLMNLNQYASKSAQPGLAVGKLQGLKTPLPTIDEQKHVAYILDKFDALTNSIAEGLPREIALRQQQYEYYRDLLFSFPKPADVAN
jgi:type I restriction enzyme S subunit